MELPDVNLILGALDSLGVALADHNHQWTEGERAIYEKAVEIVAAAQPQCSEQMWGCQDGEDCHICREPASGAASGTPTAYAPGRVAGREPQECTCHLSYQTECPLHGTGWPKLPKASSEPPKTDGYCWCDMCGFNAKLPVAHRKTVEDQCPCPDCKGSFLIVGDELPDHVAPDEPMETWKPIGSDPPKEERGEPQEWTVKQNEDGEWCIYDGDRAIFGFGHLEGYERDHLLGLVHIHKVAINAAVAEKQAGIDSFRNMWSIACEQLAAEREKRERVRVQLVKEVDQDYFDTKQQLLQALAAIEWVSKRRALIIFAEEPEHVANFMEKIDDYLKGGCSALEQHDAEVSKSTVNHYIEVYQERNIAEVRKPLVEALNVLLDSVDYMRGNCKPNAQVGAVLDRVVIDKARAALALATRHGEQAMSPSDGGQAKETFKPQSSTAATGEKEKGDNGHIS